MSIQKLQDDIRLLDRFKQFVLLSSVVLFCWLLFLELSGVRNRPISQATSDNSVAPVSEPVIEIRAPSVSTVDVEPGNPPRVTFSGSAEPNSKILIRNSIRAIGSTTVDSDGNWSTTTRQLNTPKTYQLTIEQVTSEGIRIDGEPLAYAYTLDADAIIIPTPVPVASEITSDSAAAVAVDTAVEDRPVTESEAVVSMLATVDSAETIGGFTQPFVRLTGTGEPDSTAQLWLDESPIAELELNADGVWEWEGSLANYETRAWTVESAGGRSEALLFTPDQPTIEVPTLNWDGATLNGSGTPDATIAISANGEAIEEITVDAAGNWSLALDLPEGDWTVTATALDVAGDAAESSAIDISLKTPPHITNIVQVNAEFVQINGRSQPADLVVLLADDIELAQVSADESGQWTWRGALDADVMTVVAQTDAQNQSQPFVFSDLEIGRITDISLSNDDPEFGLLASGTAEANSQLQIVLDGKPVAQITSDADGNWTWESALPTGGTHQLVMQTLTDDSIVATTAPVNFTRYIAPIIDPLSIVADLEDGEASLSGTATPDGLVAIIIDGRTRKNAVVDADGIWRWDGTVAEPGTHTLELRALDSLGNIVAELDPIPFMRHRQPVIEFEWNQSFAGGVVRLVGTAAPEASFELFVNDAADSTIVADAEGAWSWEGQFPEIGEQTFTAKIFDAQEALLFSSKTLTLEITQEMLYAGRIGAVLSIDPAYSVLAELLESADLIATINQDDPITFFALNNTVLRRLPARVLTAWRENPSELATMLQHHMVPTLLLTQTDLAASDVLRSLIDAPLSINPDPLLINGAALRPTDHQVLNGVVYSINRLLLPPNQVAQPMLDTREATENGIRLAGSAEPNTTILIYDGSRQVGETIASESGAWELEGNFSAELDPTFYMLDTESDLLLSITYPTADN